MLVELEKQIDDIRSGSTEQLPIEYGHAIGAIAQAGRDEALASEGTEEAQIKRMKRKTMREIIKYGKAFLDFLRPELRILIQPENIESLEKKHQLYVRMSKTVNQK